MTATSSGSLRHRRVPLVHGPTPLVKRPALDLLLGGADLWIKRDDCTGGAEAGNKVRKLEFLLAEAQDQGADTLVTCGALQSNHARATALVGAQLGMKATLLLRVKDGRGGDGLTTAAAGSLPPVGNLLLDRMVGADVRLVTPAVYGRRAEVMEHVAQSLRARGRRPYVIPEGGSSGLGALGYVAAMEEVRQQLDAGRAGGPSFDVVVHACGSGGTAAGVALGAALHRVAPRVVAAAVCDDAAYFQKTIARLVAEARALEPSLPEPCALQVDDSAKGPAYGVMAPEQRRFLMEVARASGVLLDPVYTGKAFEVVRNLATAPSQQGPRLRVLFLHTGGLPGLLAEGPSLEDALP